MSRFFASRQSFWTTLEHRFARPSYSGGLLSSLSVFFFIAATNTMTGWLYVMSGILLALLGIAFWLVRKNLRSLTIERQPIEPVSVGDVLQISFRLHNASTAPKTLLQIIDRIPPALGPAIEQVIDQIPPRGSTQVTLSQSTSRRGIYQWQQIQLRTGAPLGLFWASRSQRLPTRAIVHPRVYPLSACPLMDQMGRDESLQQINARLAQASPEGMTRSLRPYRTGDVMRMIHWRASAKLGELRVRELENFTSGQSIVIALDSAYDWEEADFEAAVSVAATLYFYGLRQQLQVQVWTAGNGLVHGGRSVLDTLAGVQPNEWRTGRDRLAMPEEAMIWLTARPESTTDLPLGSRWLLWPGQGDASGNAIGNAQVGYRMNQTDPLPLQLTQLV